MALTCLDTIVGLSSRDCSCFSGGQTSGWNTSDSGYYLTDRDYGFPIKEALYANLDCDESDIWTLMAEAKTQGTRDFKVDLRQALAANRESRVINWRGTIAKTNANSNYSTVNTKVGIQIRPRKRLKDATLTVKAIWLGSNTTGTTTVTVTSNDPTFSTQTLSGLNTTANTFVRNELSTAIELPLYSIAMTDVRYNFSWEPGAAKPRYNKVWCCGRPAWMQHVDAFGFQVASIDDTNMLASDASAYGLALESYFGCNNLDWICDLTEMNGLDFFDLIARCVQFKSTVKLISAVLESGRVNQYTLLDGEILAEKRVRLQNMYNEYVLWIAQNMPTTATSCWGCDIKAPRAMKLHI